MAAADVRPACTLPVRGTGRRQIQARAETARVQDAGHGGAATSSVSSHVQTGRERNTMIEAVSCVGVNAERRLEVSICDDPDSHIFFEKVAAPVNPALKFPDYITEIITEIGPRTLIYIPQVFTRHLRKQHDIHEQIYTHTIQNVPTLPVSGTACGRGHSTDFGLGWEQMNLVVGRWGSRIKVRHHLLDTSVGRRSPPDPHLLQSMLGRRLESLEVLALGLGPTEITDVGSHICGIMGRGWHGNMGRGWHDLLAGVRVSAFST